MANHYATLGVAGDASRDEIVHAYRRLVRRHHPDAGGDPACFRADRSLRYRMLWAYGFALRDPEVGELAARAARLAVVARRGAVCGLAAGACAGLAVLALGY